MNIDGEYKLINKDQVNDEKPSSLHVFYLDILYDDIKKEQVGHGGRDKTYKQCKLVFSNVTVEVINVWLQTCVECIVRKKKKTISRIVIKPVM